MNSKRVQLLLAGATACISLMCFITPTQGANIVIGENTTDIGTIIFVSPKPGDTPVAAGTALRNTLDTITDNSATNPYLIKVGPGNYDLGTSTLQMKEYVDIEGSGEKLTKITSTVGFTALPITAGTVNGANNAEIRVVTVEVTGTTNYKAAFYNSSQSPSMTHMTVSALGGANSHGIYNSSSSPVMTHVTASASAESTAKGVHNFSSSPIMKNLTISASGGLASMGVHNDTSSPVMVNVTVSASGGTLLAYGVNNFFSSPVMKSVTASASGGVSNIGIVNYTSSPVMTDVTASGSGGTDNYGVSNFSSSLTMTNLIATASGGSNNIGVRNLSGSATPTVKINHSVIQGSNNTIANEGGVTTLVGATQLDGGAVSNSGTLTCVGVYDENYAALNAICQ